MIPSSLIIKKREGGSLTADEWAEFLDAYRDGGVTDDQVSALLMAIYFQGLTDEETSILTRIMIESGERWTWEADPRPIGDKHSTGGVGDTVSLVLAPLAAACGLRVPMVSGRGLGHTSGTLDKMSAIPGYRTNLEKSEFDALLKSVGYAMGGQTERFAPLDRRLYALRDVTGTIDSVSLITASIMSKKIAEGLDALVLDVKWGDGAFMRNRGQAEVLARKMIATGREFGVETEALLTDMDSPLGRTVGHSLEVIEAIDLLKGEAADQRLQAVIEGLAVELLIMTDLESDRKGALDRIREALSSGAALERFVANVEAQGGDSGVVDDPSLMPMANPRQTIEAPTSGWLAALPARAVGETLLEIGGGRRFKTDDVDLGVGFELEYNVGDRVDRGAPWCVIHARTDEDALFARSVLESVVEWSEEPVASDSVITALVSD